MATTDVAAFFAALLGIPHLPGALCRGRPDLFDLKPGTSTDRDAVATQALALCRACPALANCQRWFESLPRKERPSGVVAGRINESLVTRSRSAISDLNEMENQ